MKLTESELRNMIYEEVLDTLNDLDENWVSDKLNNVKSVARKAGEKIGNFARNAMKSVAKANNPSNSELQDKLASSMHNKQKKWATTDNTAPAK